MDASPPLEPTAPAQPGVGYRSTAGIIATLLVVLGALVVAGSAIAIIYLLAIDVGGAEFEAHEGIAAFVALPGVFLAGLFLFSAAAWWRSREHRKHPTGRPPRLRGPSAFGLISTGALAVLLLLGAVGFRAVEFMESATFCAACHGVMGPQTDTHQLSPHAEVACTKCHIGAEAGPVGPGARAYIESKIGGMRQTLAVLTEDFERPIRAPEGKLPKTGETCLGCHSAEKDYGISVRVYRSYLPDEANTSHRRVLAFRVGGGEESGDAPAIHWHTSAKLWYQPADETGQVIASVRLETDSGMVEWTNPNVNLAERPVAERLMDCTDCHNRVGHNVPFPGTLVDQAIRDGRIDGSLPYLKREALHLLGADGTSGNAEVQAARVQSPGWFEALRAFYQREYPEIAMTRGAAIDAAIAELKAISARTLFPDMHVNWQTYPDNLQHSLPDGLDLAGGSTTPGCFRCHGTLVETVTGARLAGTMGGEGCMACHGVAEPITGGVEVIKQPEDTQGCGMCHVNVPEDQIGLWLAEDLPGRLAPH